MPIIFENKKFTFFIVTFKRIKIQRDIIRN
jgi:hypothetical protein